MQNYNLTVKPSTAKNGSRGTPAVSGFGQGYSTFHSNVGLGSETGTKTMSRPRTQQNGRRRKVSYNQSFGGSGKDQFSTLNTKGSF
jgi:hypothetical protein